MRNLKNDLEYKQELLEWENLFIRLSKLITSKGWTVELDNLEKSWVGVRRNLRKLYSQDEIETSRRDFSDEVLDTEIAADDLPI